MDDLSSWGIDMNDPTTWHMDMDSLSDAQLDRLKGVKRLFSRYFGKEFAETAASTMTGGGSIAKRRRLHHGSTGDREFHSSLSPIISKSHAKAFYDDPRDKLHSDLMDEDSLSGAEHCCDRCQLMTGTAEGLRALVSPEGYELYTCEQVRKQANISGCPFCELVRRTMTRCVTCSMSPKEQGVIRIRAIAEEDGTADGHPFRPNPRLEALKLEIPTEPMLDGLGDDLHHDHELGVVAFPESPAARYVVGTRPHKDLTPDLVRRLRAWFDDCQEGRDGHESCPRRSSPVLPTRVVDIGDGEGSPIRLQINQSGSKGQYVALSYCWGGDQPYKTTKSNINDYAQELAPTIFPKTLSDAIRVCRTMGIRYIWIDALCIVQDDPQDKDREISQMGKIYKDATLTIMAASAKNVHEGFLGGAKPDAPEAKLPFHLDRDSFGAIFVSNPANEQAYFLDEEPIYNRAWTLQEMMLSSRIIMFDSYQATLKCGRKNFWPALDTYLHPLSRISSAFATKGVDTLKEFHIQRLAKEYREDPSLAAHDAHGFRLRDGRHSTHTRIWTTMMAEYSRRDLAMLDDRYPALAGVTEELQKIWSDEFVAGFWRSSIVDHLGWVGGVCVDERFAGRKWDRKLEGPSWSWMSHPSSISIDPIAISDVEVLGCEIELANPDQPYGAVKHGSLALQGRTLPLSALEARLNIRPNVNSSWKISMAIMPASVDGIALDFPERGWPDGELKALVLGMTYSKLNANCVSFLLLRKLEGDTYERFGHASMQTELHLDESVAMMARAEREVVVIE